MPLPMMPEPGAAMLPPGSLRGASVMITGGGTGFGLGLSLEFARLGAMVIVASRSAENRDAGVARILADGGQAAGAPLDLFSVASIEAAFDEAGPVDILINNAAANFFAPAEDISERGWDTIVDRVLKGAFFCSQAFARRAIAAGRPGAILNIVSGPGLQGGPGVVASGAAKAGMVNMTKSLAVEWARDGIRVNALCPGVFPHDDDPPAVKAGRIHFGQEIGETIPVGRPGELREAGWLATYLCSPFASYVTGQVVVIDGGAQLPAGIARPKFTPVREQVPKRG
ncbi:MAG: fadH 3 [Phenylobacterium sp.]|nr:fadH 3 [Phenylobacterium sp.]